MYRDPDYAATAGFSKLRIGLELSYDRLPQLLTRDRLGFVRQANVIRHISISRQLAEYLKSKPTVEDAAYICRALALL
jgi:hypothetical protein